MQEKLSTVDSDTTRDLVRTLRQRIVAWQYPPQFQLIEEALAQEFGVSRSPIRQALMHLSAEGLLQRLPRRGFRVQQLQLRDVEDLYEFRLALEVQVVRVLAHKGVPEATLFQLQAMSQDSPNLASRAVSELAALDESFHATLAEAHGNRMIIQQLKAINERLFAFREIDFKQFDRLDSTCDEHNRLLHALLSHDVEQACELIRLNINSALGNVENTIVQLVARSYLNPAIHSNDQGESS